MSSGRPTRALALLLFRHWARAALPNRLRRDKGRRVSAGLFRFGYFAMMSAWGYAVGRLVGDLEIAEQNSRGAAWILLGVIGLAVTWSALTRGPTLRGEPSPLEATFLDALPLPETSRLAVGLLERLFVYSLGGAALIGVFPFAPVRAITAAVILSTAGVLVGEAMMRVARVLLPAMTIARARSYLLVFGQIVFLMCIVQAPSLARSVRLGVVVSGWPSRIARAIQHGDGFALLIVATPLVLIAIALLAIALAERVGYDKLEVVPTGRPRRERADALSVDRIDDVLRKREPGGRWSTAVMMAYTALVTAGIVTFAWSAKKAATLEAESMVRGACGLAAFGAFVVVTARASRMATRDVAARPMLAPLPIEPRALLSGKVVRLRRDAVIVALPLLALLATPWSFAMHLEIAWRVGAILLGVVFAARAAASVAFLTVGAGSKRGPGGSFVVESVLVLVPLVGVATAPHAWAVVVPLAALFFVAREATRSGLGCVRWLDDADDFERETPIWRALLVFGAFQSVQVLGGRVVGLSELDSGTKLAIAYGVSSIVLVALTAHARREAPRLRVLPQNALWLGAGAVAGLVSGVLAVVYVAIARRFGLGPPEALGMSRIALGVMAIGLAPPAEEIFFRGWLYPCIEDELAATPGKRLLAPALGAFAFAAAHPPTSFVPVLVLGLVATLLFARTRAIGPGIVAHVAHNALVVWIAG